jgi:serine/threonine-protein kinase
MAPEQAMGQTDLDGRVDIYATGCVAYWLLTGQTVFTSETTMGLLLKHLPESPASPSTRGVAVPAALDDLVLSCLAKDPNDRPQSARALSSRLAGIDGSTVWTEDRARGWWAQYQSIRATG